MSNPTKVSVLTAQPPTTGITGRWGTFNISDLVTGNRLLKGTLRPRCLPLFVLPGFQDVGDSSAGDSSNAVLCSNRTKATMTTRHILLHPRLGGDKPLFFSCSISDVCCYNKEPFKKHPCPQPEMLQTPKSLGAQVSYLNTVVFACSCSVYTYAGIFYISLGYLGYLIAMWMFAISYSLGNDDKKKKSADVQSWCQGLFSVVVVFPEDLHSTVKFLAEATEIESMNSEGWLLELATQTWESWHLDPCLLLSAVQSWEVSAPGFSCSTTVLKW